MHLFRGKLRQRAVCQSLRFNDTPQLWPGFSLSGPELQHACYEEFLEHGLRELLRAGLARDFGECGGQRFIAYPPTAINNWEGYDLLQCVFPHQGQPVRLLIDELSAPQQERLRTMINWCFERYQSVAASRGRRFSRLYFLQHVAPYQTTVFTNSYPHLHMHAFGFVESARHETPPPPASLRRLCRHNVFFDPFCAAWREIFAHDLGRDVLQDDRTSSLIVARRPLEGRLSTEELQLIAGVSAIWKRRWRRLARCFGNLEADADYDIHQLAPFPRDVMADRLRAAFHADLACLAAESRRRLLELASRLAPAYEWRDERHCWKNLMNGPYGSIGVVFNFDVGEQEVRVAPRTFGSTRTGATDACWLTLKDRQRTMDASTRAQIFDLQREILADSSA